MKNTFKVLGKSYWQFSSNCKLSKEFYVGQKVFLKTQLNLPLIVIFIDDFDNEVLVIPEKDWVINDYKNTYAVKPWCLIHQAYRGLLESVDGKYKISLN